MNSQKRIIVVLGMHRSGTSAITRGLNVLGANLGDRLLAPLSGVNSKGFFEDIDILKLNIEILQAIGSDWHCVAPIEPRDIETLNQKGYFLRAVELLRKKIADIPVFCFKDPRVAKLLPFWHPVFVHCGLDIAYLLAIRNPLSIAKSLEKRDGFSHEKTYLLCLGHILTSLIQTESHTRILVDYDRFLDTPKLSLENIARQFSLQVNQQDLDEYESSFLDNSLRHSVYTTDDLALDPACPPLMHELYTDLLNKVQNGTEINKPEFHNLTALWAREFERFKSSLHLADQMMEHINQLNIGITDVIKSVLNQDLNIFRAAFDADWYVKTYPYLNLTDMDPYQHYVNFGIVDGRFPSNDIAHFMREGVQAYLLEVDTQIKEIQSLNESQSHKLTENEKFISEQEQTSVDNLTLKYQQVEAHLRERAEREITVSQQIQEIYKAHEQQNNEQRREYLERDQVRVSELTLTRQQLQTQLIELVERERAFSEKLQNIQQAHAQQTSEQQREHTEREQANATQLTQTRHHLETLLRELNEREKAFAEQLQNIQQAHAQRTSEQQREHTEREQAIATQLTQTRHQLETLLRELNEREKAFAEQLHDVQQAHAQRTSEQQREHTEREQAIAIQLAQTRHQLETLLRELNEREKAFAEQLKNIQQAHIQQANERSQTNEEREQILNARLLSKQDELYQLTQNWLEAEQAYAQTLNQFQYQLNSIRNSYSWRWTAPFRSFAQLFLNEDERLQKNMHGNNDKFQHASNLMQGETVNHLPHSNPNIDIHEQNTMANSDPASTRINVLENQSPRVANSIEELLSFYDEEFVNCAYYTLLGRGPDAEGMRYYLARVRSGVSKIEILSQLHLSTEGKSHRVTIANLGETIKRHKLLKIPMIRASLQMLGVKWAENGMPQRLRAIENKLHIQQCQINQRIEKTYSELSWSLLQIKELIEDNQAAVKRVIQNNQVQTDFDRKSENDASAIGIKTGHVFNIKSSLKWCVLTTPHTLFVAQMIANRLIAHGWSVDILTDAPNNFPHDMYVVICPQIFKILPPGEKRIAYQMEQSVSSRWFTDDYLNILENSRAVLEYSLVNLEFLADKKVAYPHVHYLPVGAISNYESTFGSHNKTNEILFYGDDKSSPRRLAMLETLKKHFDVRVCSDIFGREMVDAILGARVVINLHYYENALLEMPRIQECLSLGVPVVSEFSQDQNDYPELAQCVRFFKEGDENDMVETVRKALFNIPSNSAIADSVKLSADRFAFMFDRFLVAQGFLPSSYVQQMSLPIDPNSDRIALAMPETISRRLAFESSKPVGCTVFDGIRLSPGWVGCGLSYSALSRNALKGNIARLTIMEDDVILPDNFEDEMKVVHEYLDRCDDKWDIFAGLVAVLHPDARILKVEDFKGVRFATIDKMTSTVCNIYSRKAMQILASWDPDHRNDQTNTIDKYLERQTNLRVVVTLPFMVGHREEVYSSLWGFQNTQYRDLIAASQRELEIKVSNYIKQRIGAARISSS